MHEYACATVPSDTRTLFSDLRRYQSSMKHYRQSLPKVYVQQFLYENSTQLYSYLVYRFVLSQG